MTPFHAMGMPHRIYTSMIPFGPGREVNILSKGDGWRTGPSPAICIRAGEPAVFP